MLASLTHSRSFCSAQSLRPVGIVSRVPNSTGYGTNNLQPALRPLAQTL